MSPLIIILIIIAVIVIAVIGLYNGLVTKRSYVSEALADIDVQLKRRYDLIPNLVNTVKGYATHESGTLEAVITARNTAMSQMSGGIADKELADGALSGALKSIFALSENYPDLKANTNFIELQRELSDTENKLQAARRFYNGTVQDYNTSIQMFPGNIFAGMFGFKPTEFFELGADEQAARNPVEVKF
jgi:LemA protein